MKYDELVKKYKRQKEENESKSCDIKALNDEIEALQQKLDKKGREKGAKKQSNTFSSAQVPKGASKGNLTSADEIDGPVGVPGNAPCLKGDDVNLGMFSQLDETKITIEQLKGENEHYKDMVTTLEDQIDELKEINTEKDQTIMKMRNDIGKLKIYIEAGKQERERLTQELHTEMAKNRQRNDERFDGLENQLELVLQFVNNGKITRNTNEQVGGWKASSPRNNKKTNKKFGR